MATKYEWSEGARWGADPQEVGEAIEALGSPTAERIVEAAKRKTSPLHGVIFAKGDDEAAHEHRLYLARAVVRSLCVTVIVEKEPMPIRAFEAVTVEPGEMKQYVPTMKALRRSDQREEVMGRLRTDLQAANRQLRAYAYLGNEFALASKHVEKAVGVLQPSA